MNNEKKQLIYDIGELGWSMVISAHVNYMVDSGNQMVVTAYPERQCLYNGLRIEFIKLPQAFWNSAKGLDRDGTHLYNHETKQRFHHDALNKIFQEAYGRRFDVVEKYTEFEILPYRYVPSKNAISEATRLFGIPDGKMIIVFPRNRKGKFGYRNLSKLFYNRLIEEIITKYPSDSYSKIVSFTNKEEGYVLSDDIVSDKLVDLVKDYDDLNKLDLLLALCDQGYVKCTVGSQSALPKIALVMGIPSFIIGHEKERHIITDNWMQTFAEFYSIIEDANGNYKMSYLDESICFDLIGKFFDKL